MNRRGFLLSASAAALAGTPAPMVVGWDMGAPGGDFTVLAVYDESGLDFMRIDNGKIQLLRGEWLHHWRTATLP